MVTLFLYFSEGKVTFSLSRLGKEKLISLKPSFKKVRESNIVITNNGLHNVPGFRLGELLIMGKLVITTPINIKVPGLLNGIHYIECEIEKMNELLDSLSIAKIHIITNNARKYANEFLGPSMRLNYCVDKINLGNI